MKQIFFSVTPVIISNYLKHAHIHYILDVGVMVLEGFFIPFMGDFKNIASISLINVYRLSKADL